MQILQALSAARPLLHRHHLIVALHLLFLTSFTARAGDVTLLLPSPPCLYVSAWTGPYRAKPKVPYPVLHRLLFYQRLAELHFSDSIGEVLS